MPITSSQLAEQRKRVQEAGGKATRLAGIGGEFQQRVKEELRQRAASRGIGQLAERASAARQEFTAAPTRIREKFAGAQPQAVSAQIGATRADIMKQLSDIAAAQEQQGVTVQDITGAAQTGLETEALREAGQQGVETQAFQDLLAQAQFEEQQRQFDIETELSKARIAASGTGGTRQQEDLGFLQSFAQAYNILQTQPKTRAEYEQIRQELNLDTTPLPEELDQIREGLIRSAAEQRPDLLTDIKRVVDTSDLEETQGETILPLSQRSPDFQDLLNRVQSMINNFQMDYEEALAQYPELTGYVKPVILTPPGGEEERSKFLGIF